MIGGSAMLAYRFPGSFEENQQLPIKYECASFGPKYAFIIANAIDLCITQSMDAPRNTHSSNIFSGDRFVTCACLPVSAISFSNSRLSTLMN